ncbi:MAG: TolC family protein, partial [Azonexus sp.]
GTPMPLADSEDPIVSTLPADTEALERMALERRPEIMEEWYRKRVTATDIKIAKAQVWPNLSLEAGPLYDSNKYLFNNNWAEVGLRLSFNLIKLLQWPALDQAQADQEQTDDMRRMGLSMAVLTQVHVGKQRYELSLSELKFAEEIMRVDGRLLEYAKAAASTSVDSELEVIRAEARSLLARYQRQAAYSNAQAAWGRFYNSVGLDVMPEAIESHDVKTLAAEIKRTMGEWESAGLLAPEAPG